MRIAAMAAGAVGAYFGARLQAAGHEVFYIARGAHREAIEKNGLKIESVHGDLHLPKVNVTDDPAKVGPVDVVLFAVKLWDTEKAAEQARPLLGPDTRVVTLQNGVDSYERIAPIVGAERAIPGVTYVVTVIDRPGVIKQASQFQSIICGTHDGRADAPLAAFVAAAKAAWARSWPIPTPARCSATSCRRPSRWVRPRASRSTTASSTEPCCSPTTTCRPA
jgi:2-dehydropantoate 2-reductase